MELLLIMLGLVALGALAMRFGYDSRDTLPSAEQRLARHGVVWDGPPRWTRRARRGSIKRHRHTLRRRMAAVLYRVADWLYPGTSEPHTAAM